MSTSRFVGVVQQWRSAEPFEVFWVCEDFEPGGRQIELGGRQGVEKWCRGWRSVLLWILCEANISGREKQREVWECAKVSKADQLVHGYHKRFTIKNGHDHNLFSKTDKTSRCPTENQYDDVRNVVSGNPLPGTSWPCRKECSIGQQPPRQSGRLRTHTKGDNNNNPKSTFFENLAPNIGSDWKYQIAGRLGAWHRRTSYGGSVECAWGDREKGFFCLGVELLNCLALCDMILLTFDKHRSSATSLMLGALEWQCGRCWALLTSRTRVWARQRWTTQHGFTNCDRCGWAKQEWTWFCCDGDCQKSDGGSTVIFCARWKRDWRQATTWWRRPPTTSDTTRRAGLQLIRSQPFS